MNIRRSVAHEKKAYRSWQQMLLLLIFQSIQISLFVRGLNQSYFFLISEYIDRKGWNKNAIGPGPQRHLPTSLSTNVYACSSPQAPSLLSAFQIARASLPLKSPPNRCPIRIAVRPAPALYISFSPPVSKYRHSDGGLNIHEPFGNLKPTELALRSAVQYAASIPIEKEDGVDDAISKGASRMRMYIPRHVHAFDPCRRGEFVFLLNRAQRKIFRVGKRGRRLILWVVEAKRRGCWKWCLCRVYRWVYVVLRVLYSDERQEVANVLK